LISYCTAIHTRYIGETQHKQLPTMTTSSSSHSQVCLTQLIAQCFELQTLARTGLRRDWTASECEQAVKLVLANQGQVEQLLAKATATTAKAVANPPAVTRLQKLRDEATSNSSTEAPPHRPPTAATERAPELLSLSPPTPVAGQMSLQLLASVPLTGIVAADLLDHVTNRRDEPVHPAFMKKKRGRPPIKKPAYCLACGINRTPEWRRGPGGFRLCNACGLQYNKKSKREKESKQKHSIDSLLNKDGDGSANAA